MAISTISTFVDYAKSCTVVELDTFKKVTRGQDLCALASAHVRTDSNIFGQISSLYEVTKGIIDTLAYGQKSRLTGFTLASKKQVSGFAALVALNIVSDGGQILISVDTESKKKETVKMLSDYILPFMGKLWAERSAHAESMREAAKQAREDKKKESSKLESVLGAAPDMAAPTATTASPLDVVAQTIALIQAGMVSEADMRALMDAINAAPIGEAAPVLTLGFTPAKKTRKPRKPKATV